MIISPKSAAGTRRAAQQLSLALRGEAGNAGESAEEEPKKHGGARAGAGRKPAKRRNVPHRARPLHKERLPSLVTLRAVGQLPSFRAERVLRLFKELIFDQRRRYGD